jgi:hypothetical protein
VLPALGAPLGEITLVDVPAPDAGAALSASALKKISDDAMLAPAILAAEE